MRSMTDDAADAAELVGDTPPAPGEDVRMRVNESPKPGEPGAHVEDADPVSPADLRQGRAIVALLASPTIKAAAEEVGIHERTLRDWLKREDFAEAVRVARRQTLAQASTRLVASTTAASDALVAVLEDADAPHASKVAAAKAILEHARGFVELDDALEGMRALERRIDEQKGQRR